MISPLRPVGVVAVLLLLMQASARRLPRPFARLHSRRAGRTPGNKIDTDLLFAHAVAGPCPRGVRS